MVRTQISLAPEEISWLRQQAKNRDTSMAGIVRQLVQNAAANRKGITGAINKLTGKQYTAVKKLHPWIGKGKDGLPSDVRLTDDYLYGEGEPV